MNDGYYLYFVGGSLHRKIRVEKQLPQCIQILKPLRFKNTISYDEYDPIEVTYRNDTERYNMMYFGNKPLINNGKYIYLASTLNPKTNKTINKILWKQQKKISGFNYPRYKRSPTML